MSFAKRLTNEPKTNIYDFIFNFQLENQPKYEIINKKARFNN